MQAIFVGGRLNGKQIDIEEVKRTYGNGTFTPNYSEERAAGLCVPRQELDVQPKVDGYCGPMWDGDRLRYETLEVYEALSR